MAGRPVVIISGVGTTSLENTASYTYEKTWSGGVLEYFKLMRLALNENGDADMQDDMVMQSSQLIPDVYKNLQDTLADYLDTKAYIFSYDWRLSNSENGQRLVDFVKQLRKKSNAMADGKYDFVVHSMGGLIMRSGLKIDSGIANKVVFLGTPHKGALMAISATIMGIGLP